MNYEYREGYQTKTRGSLEDEYNIYKNCVDNGNGKDMNTGKPIKTFDEWLNS